MQIDINATANGIMQLCYKWPCDEMTIRSSECAHGGSVQKTCHSSSTRSDCEAARMTSNRRNVAAFEEIQLGVSLGRGMPVMEPDLE